MPHPHDDLDFAQTLRGGGQPTLLGRYRVVRELGHGGMGSVYLAEDTHLDGRLVAIKMPSAILARNKRAVADLKREATTAMALTHPAIVTLRSFEQSDEGVFLVMDYVEGETLEDRLADKGTLTADEVVKLLGPVAEALDYAHERRVIHRDLKPANILIDTDGRAHLTDFGIAREMKDTMTRVTGKQDTSGTLPYMSPEQVNGENPTPAQDLYSFGALLYECLAGHPPFYRGQIEHQILNRDPDPLPDSPLAKQVMACLAKDADQRPSKAAAVFTAPGRAEPTTSRDRQGAGPSEAKAAPLPDGRGQSEAYAQLAEVFDDAMSGKLTSPPAAKPWQRPPESFSPTPAVTPKKHEVHENSRGNQTGCAAAALAAIFLAGVCGIVIWLLSPGPVLRDDQPGQALTSSISEALEAHSGAASPHADRPDEPIMIGATYAADLGDGVELVLTYIPSTEEIPETRGRGYLMGSPSGERGRQPDEAQHRVVLSRPFLMGETEVTQAQFAAVMDGRNPSAFAGRTLPVEQVSHHEALVFCQRLTEREHAAGRLPDGWRYTLPTEAQWEWARRAGSSEAFENRPERSASDETDDGPRVLSLGGAHRPEQTSPVRSTLPNAWGLYEMRGNVWEWCLDHYGPYSQHSTKDPVIQVPGSNSVVRRGGSWYSDPNTHRAAARLIAPAGDQYADQGFRVILVSEGVDTD